ncbi:MAG: alpha/beta fold hydrolase [Steroidobacteraceae bacterium]|jgi:pimeloyl-ACP methyl ester carboxylesterase
MSLPSAQFWRTPPNVRRRYAESGAGQIHYRIAVPEQTARVPLLCIHLTPNSGRVYARFIAEMGRDRLAIAPDTPGFGGSSTPAEPPSIAALASLLGAFLDGLAAAHDLRRIDVMGYHTGSKIALELARQRPQQVRRVVLVSAPVYTASELDAQRATLAAAGGEVPLRDGSHLRERWRGHWQFKDPLADAWFVQREVAEGLRVADSAWRTYRAAFEVQHAEVLPQVAQPVLLLCPDDDLATPTRRAAALLRNGRFLPLPGWAHGFLDVHTGEAAMLVREFLDGPADDTQAVNTIAKPAPPAALTPLAGTAARGAYHDGPSGLLHFRHAGRAGGDRPPLYLLHMSPNSNRIFEALQRAMASDREVVAVDTPGFGESEPTDAAPSIETYAAAVADLARARGHTQIDVLGYHTGAMTAIALAVAQPQRVRRVVQISSPVFTAAELASFRAEYGEREPREDGGHLVDAWLNMQRFYNPDVPLAVLARNFAEGLRGGPFAHWGHKAAFDYDLAAALPRVTQPVLVVNPEDDLAVQTPRGFALLRTAQWLDLPGRAHGFLDTHTAEFATRLRAFLDVSPFEPPHPHNRRS